MIEENYIVQYNRFNISDSVCNICNKDVNVTFITYCSDEYCIECTEKHIIRMTRSRGLYYNSNVCEFNLPCRSVNCEDISCITGKKLIQGLLTPSIYKRMIDINSKLDRHVNCAQPTCKNITFISELVAKRGNSYKCEYCDIACCTCCTNPYMFNHYCNMKRIIDSKLNQPSNCYNVDKLSVISSNVVTSDAHSHINDGIAKMIEENRKKALVIKLKREEREREEREREARNEMLRLRDIEINALLRQLNDDKQRELQIINERENEILRLQEQVRLDRLQ